MGNCLPLFDMIAHVDGDRLKKAGHFRVKRDLFIWAKLTRKFDLLGKILPRHPGHRYDS